MTGGRTQSVPIEGRRSGRSCLEEARRTGNDAAGNWKRWGYQAVG
eukprot:CAMPEP_0197554950 /NCGR_PEP_ID=MMETSP1320-20131121/12385_1 /TAXON_ID=91990 /ORGANISM="Bolidomonas sp., Strain RCC2347" /LENGTH=44 /DNA_ID= /DNA_START= /DNA_END= /DNA_ORIENTATION=